MRVEKEPRVLFPQVPEPHMVPLRRSSGKDGLCLDGRFPAPGVSSGESVLSGFPRPLGAGFQLALHPASGKAAAASSREEVKRVGEARLTGLLCGLDHGGWATNPTGRWLFSCCEGPPVWSCK